MPVGDVSGLAIELTVEIAEVRSLIAGTGSVSWPFEAPVSLVTPSKLCAPSEGESGEASVSELMSWAAGFASEPPVTSACALASSDGRPETPGPVATPGTLIAGPAEFRAMATAASEDSGEGFIVPEADAFEAGPTGGEGGVLLETGGAWLAPEPFELEPGAGDAGDVEPPVIGVVVGIVTAWATAPAAWVVVADGVGAGPVAVDVGAAAEFAA